MRLHDRPADRSFDFVMGNLQPGFRGPDGELTGVPPGAAESEPSPRLLIDSSSGIRSLVDLVRRSGTAIRPGPDVRPHMPAVPHCRFHPIVISWCVWRRR